MPLGAVVAVASSFINTKSPRYGGGDGPLYSTVNGFVDRVASGDLAVLQQLNTLRVVDADKVQWQLFWDQMVPIQPLTQAQVDLIKRLDPTKTGIVARRGTAIYASPSSTPPTLQQVAEGLVHAMDRPAGSVTTDSPPLSVANPAAGLAALPLWALALLAGGAAWFVYKMVKKG